VQRCKEAKKAKWVAQRKQGKHINIAWRREVHIKHTNTTEVYLISGHIQTNPRRNGCNHTSTNPRRVQSMAKPRSSEANMEIKHRSKQANIDMQNEMIQTL